jgi:hypothetical protein
LADTQLQKQFIFESKTRDKLLFEDAHFTYIRRYFWANNTLEVINDGIKSMISACDVFDNDFWAGRHQSLWPHPNPESDEGIAYKNTMHPLKVELRKAVLDLHDVLERNERTQEQIESLREQLYSGTSVLEARKAIEQGDAVKILTGVSMIFLPLTFVTVAFPWSCHVLFRD